MGRMRMGYVIVVIWLLVLIAASLPSCMAGDSQGGSDELIGGGPANCHMDGVQNPLGAGKPFARHGGRGFLSNGNHLGTDILLPEGYPIYPIGCGVVRLARAASGYGTLAVVIEHTLPMPIELTNGLGQTVRVERLISIYGHLRATSDVNGRGRRTAISVGSVVTPETVIGYVQSDALNGDGVEHLHLGIRLQSGAEAQRTDPSAWFRGYDGSPSQRRWYGNPETVLAQLASALPESSYDTVSSMTDAGLVIQPDIVAPAPTPSPDVVTVTDVPTVSVRDVVAVLPPPSDAGVVARDVVIESPPALVRYEFRARATFPHRHGEPYRLRDRWWGMVTCQNTRSVAMQQVDGWWRCDAPRTDPFDGSLFLPDHLDWGDRGQIGTVANVPERCTPQPGIDWRITDLASNRVLYEGDVSGLACLSVGTQDRLMLP